MASFKDHFSIQAGDYAQYRPNYPAALFEYLSSLVSDHTLAWDCATGSGQAALGLTPYFDKIIATDPSAAQIQNAVPHPKIEYAVAAAEQSGIASQSLNLITVAQALHWFDLEKFYAEVRCALKPQGVLAVWTYNLLRCRPKIDALLLHYYSKTVGPYWPPERKAVEEEYRNIPFPFTEIQTPLFSMEAHWDLRDLMGYLRTWSATQQYIQQLGKNPLPDLFEKLKKEWGDPDKKRVMRWPLFMRVGRGFGL